MLLFILLKIIACAYFRDTKLNICDFLKKKSLLLFVRTKRCFQRLKLKKQQYNMHGVEKHKKSHFCKELDYFIVRIDSRVRADELYLSRRNGNYHTGNRNRKNFFR